MCFTPQRREFFHSSTSKSGPSMNCLTLFTPKCASRHNSVHFFPQLNFQKCSETDMFWHLSLPNVLCCTTEFKFSFTSTSIRSSAQPRCLHTALASLLSDPLEPQNIGKTQCFATWLPHLFAHLHLLSSDCLHLWSSPCLVSQVSLV